MMLMVFSHRIRQFLALVPTDMNRASQTYHDIVSANKHIMFEDHTAMRRTSRREEEKSKLDFEEVVEEDEVILKK